jgi:hypothetical protein
VNGVGRLPGQLLAAVEAAELASGPKPNGAGCAGLSEDPPADFGGHLAELVRRQAEHTKLGGDSGATPPASTRLGFGPPATTAKATAFGGIQPVPDPNEIKSGVPMAPSAATIERGPGSDMLAVRPDRFFAGLSPSRMASDGRASKQGGGLGAKAATAPAQGLPAGSEKPTGDSLDCSSTDGRARATARPGISADAPRAAEASVSERRLPANASFPHWSGSETGSLTAGALASAFSQASRPDLAATGENEGGPVPLAAGLASLEECAGSNRLRAERLDCKESLPLEPNGEGELDTASRLSVRVRTLAQETHLAPVNELSPALQLMALSQLSRIAVKGGKETVPGQTLIKAANLDRDAAGAQGNEDHFGSIPIGSAESLEAFLIPSLRTSATDGNEGALSPSKIPESTESSPRALRISGSVIREEIARQTMNLGLAVDDGQLPGNELARTRPEQIGAPDAGEPSPLGLSSTAVGEPAHPISSELLSPAMQITNSIVAAGYGGSVPDSARPQSGPPAQGQILSRVQTLRVQLEPENLGKVTVNLRLAGAKLEVQVEAEQPETAHLIGGDKELISARLQSSGYAIDTLTIRTVDSQAPQPALTSSTQPKEDQYAGHANGGPTAHDRPSTYEEPPPQTTSEDDASVSNRFRAADGELYV